MGLISHEGHISLPGAIFTSSFPLRDAAPPGKIFSIFTIGCTLDSIPPDILIPEKHNVEWVQGVQGVQRNDWQQPCSYCTQSLDSSHWSTSQNSAPSFLQFVLTSWHVCVFLNSWVLVISDFLMPILLTQVVVAADPVQHLLFWPLR